MKHNPPPTGKQSAGQNPKITVTPNPDGSITVVVSNGGATETFTVKPETNPQGTTTVVSAPSAPNSNASVTTDKNGETNAKAKAT